MNYEQRIPQQQDDTPSEATKDREIADLKEELRRLKLKRAHKLRNKDPAVFVHPRDDTAFQPIRKAKKFRNANGLTAVILKHGSRQALLSHYDPGPAPKGLVQCPAITFENDIIRTGGRLGVELPPELIQEAAQAIEKRVEERFRVSEDRYRRSINSMAYAGWLRDGGLQPEPSWWRFHNPPGDDDEANETEEEPTDTTNATAGTSYEADPEDEDDDCPPEYYEMRDDSDYEDWDNEPSREDDEDDSVDDGDESLDDTEEETSDDEEDDHQ